MSLLTTTSIPEPQTKSFDIPRKGAWIAGALGRFKVDQPGAIVFNQEVALVAVSMSDAEMVELSQNSLALVDVDFHGFSSTFDPLDGEANDPVFFVNKAQELGSDTAGLDAFVDVAFFLDLTDFMFKSSHFDDNQTTRRMALSGHVDL
jgi:hypothetical protein